MTSPVSAIPAASAEEALQLPGRRKLQRFLGGLDISLNLSLGELILRYSEKDGSII